MTNWSPFLVPSECLLAKICCSWSSDKFAKRATCEFFSALFLLLVGWGPKRSVPIEKLGSSSLVSSIFQREGKLHCSLTGQKLRSQVKKMLTSIYLRTGVILFMQLNRTYIGQARALCYNRRIGPCSACVNRGMDVHEKFGDDEIPLTKQQSKIFIRQ